MIRARSEQQYPTTLLVRTYFLICIAAFYAATSDPLFLVLGVIVGPGFVLTLGSYLADRTRRVGDPRGAASGSRARPQQGGLAKRRGRPGQDQRRNEVVVVSGNSMLVNFQI